MSIAPPPPVTVSATLTPRRTDDDDDDASSTTSSDSGPAPAWQEANGSGDCDDAGGRWRMHPEVKELTTEDPETPCDFCHRSKLDDLNWGPMYQLDGLTTHYFCLLFSAQLNQDGRDEQGILGFLQADIQRELNRGRNLECEHCGKTCGTVACSKKGCKASFHYPCGLEDGALFQFLGAFGSYCRKHRGVGKPTATQIKVPREMWECPICQGGPASFKGEKYPLKPPCCRMNTGVFHRNCIMTMAKNFGLHYFKCPLCTNKHNFARAMQQSGIFVPDRDAEWELEPMAYHELKDEYKQCDVEPCQCPKGKEYDSTPTLKTKKEFKYKLDDWRIIRCGACGAGAVHIKCGGLTNFTYRCETCKGVLLSGRGRDQDMENGEFTYTPRSAMRRRQARICRRRESHESENSQSDSAESSSIEGAEADDSESLLEAENRNNRTRTLRSRRDRMKLKTRSNRQGQIPVEETSDSSSSDGDNDSDTIEVISPRTMKKPRPQRAPPAPPSTSSFSDSDFVSKAKSMTTNAKETGQRQRKNDILDKLDRALDDSEDEDGENPNPTTGTFDPDPDAETDEDDENLLFITPEGRLVPAGPVSKPKPTPKQSFAELQRSILMVEQLFEQKLEMIRRKRKRAMETQILGPKPKAKKLCN